MSLAATSTGSSTIRDYVTLLKPGVMLLVVFTGLVGMLLAPGELHPFLQIITILCIALGSGGGGAINMWYDRDIDTIMRRTSTRPVPAGRISPDDALAFGIGLSALSVSLLGLAVHWLAAGILAFAIFFYTVIYTVWLKRFTPQNIVIGGAAGAFPPLIGWVAVSGQVTVEPLVLFAIIFFWTPPHFWALALYRNEDYIKANVPMLPVVAGIAATKKQIIAYTLVLIAASVMPVVIGLQGMIYGGVALALGGWFLKLALDVYRSDSDKPARILFGYSILYLFALFSAMLLDKLLYLM